MPIFEFPPRPMLEIGGAVANGAQITLAADTNYAGIVFQAEFTMSVKKAWVRQTTAGTAAAGSNLTVSIETVGSTDGLPTGTTIVSQAYPNPVTFPVTFTTPGTINKGTVYCLKITQTGTPTAPNAVIITGVTNLTLESLLPYAVSNAGRNNARQTESWYLEDNSGSPIVMGYPFQLVNASDTINNAREAGMKFRIPTTVCSTYKLVGIKFSTATSDTGTPPDIRLSIYDWNSGNNSTAIETTDISPWISSSATNLGVNEYWFDNPPTLNAGSDYIVAVGTANTGSATSVTTVRNSTVLDIVKPCMWDQTNNYVFDRVSRTSYTGSWTVTADSIYTMSLLLDIVSLPSGGGLAANPLVGYVR